jgi:hypothetical protein
MFIFHTVAHFLSSPSMTAPSKMTLDFYKMLGEVRFEAHHFKMQLEKLRRELDDDMEAASALCLLSTIYQS